MSEITAFSAAAVSKHSSTLPSCVHHAHGLEIRYLILKVFINWHLLSAYGSKT